MEEFELKGINGPHAGLRVLVRCKSKNPKQALLLMHGRGSSGANVMRIVDYVRIPDDTVILAPTAEGNSWYPNRFFVPQKDNQPYLDSSLSTLNALMNWLKTGQGLADTEIIAAGFSQGACLVSQFASRRQGRLKGVCIWSGGLIGSDDEVSETDNTGNLMGTPVYLGCDRRDEHIPVVRVETSAKILEKIGAKVTLEIYDGLGHAIHERGFRYLESLLQDEKQ